MTTLPSNLDSNTPRPSSDPATDFNQVSRRIDIVLRIGLSARPERRDYPPETPLGQAVRLHDLLLRHLREFAVTARETLDSDTYTPAGLRTRLFAVGKDALTRVESAADSMRPDVVRIRDRAMAAVEKTLAPSKAEPVSLERESEARAILYKMTPAERYQAWRGIVARRDALGIAAVTNAPKFAPVLEDRLVAEGMSEIAEAADPTAVQVRNDANQALWCIDGMVEDVRAMIANASGVDLSLRAEQSQRAGVLA